MQKQSLLAIPAQGHLLLGGKVPDSKGGGASSVLSQPEPHSLSPQRGYLGAEEGTFFLYT